MSITDEKSRLRRELKLRRAQVSQSEREIVSQVLCRKLWAFLEKQDARCIGVYLATPTEISLDPLIEILLRQKIEVAAPRVNLQTGMMAFFRFRSLDDVQIGPWKVREPTGSEEIVPDCLLVPGLAFDARGQRLGMGAGWYDRTLSEQILKVGACYDWQIIPRVPTKSHDLAMNWVFSDLRQLGPF